MAWALRPGQRSLHCSHLLRRRGSSWARDPVSVLSWALAPGGHTVGTLTLPAPLCARPCVPTILVAVFFILFYFILEREEGRPRGRERETLTRETPVGCPSPCTNCQTCNPLVHRTTLQPTEPDGPGRDHPHLTAQEAGGQAGGGWGCSLPTMLRVTSCPQPAAP